VADLADGEYRKALFTPFVRNSVYDFDRGCGRVFVDKFLPVTVAGAKRFLVRLQGTALSLMDALTVAVEVIRALGLAAIFTEDDASVLWSVK
jgi:hypothetical protein